MVVTGAAGQVGSEIVKLLIDQGHTVVAFDSKQLDIRHQQEVFRTLQQVQPIDVVINCAAYTAVDRAESESSQAFLVNTEGAANLAQVCKALNVILIHFSTDYVFDGNKADAYVETDIAHPSSVYGESKWQGEQRLRALWHKHYILRISWVFGQTGHNFVKTILRLAAQRPELRIVADQRGCPTSARHIAQVVLAMLTHPQFETAFGTYHYSDQPSTTWYEFASYFVNLAYEQKLLTRLPIITAINTCDYPTPAKRPHNSVLNCDKIKEIFGIMPYDWRDGIRKLTIDN